MYVILDVEWIERPQKRLTQLSALRVDDSYNTVDRFDSIIMQDEKYDGHVAYGGLNWREFKNGVTEDDCAKMFADWINEEDSFYVWHRVNRDAFCEMWYDITGHEFPIEIKAVRNKITDACKKQKIFGTAFYPLTQALCVNICDTEHRSSCDVDMLCSMLKILGIELTAKQKTAAVPIVIDKRELREHRRERNIAALDRLQCDFASTTSSDVFHKKGCSTLRYAKNIRGFTSYEQAILTHRPCRLCKPEPKKKVKKSRPVKTEAEYETVKMVDGGYQLVVTKNIVGRCHYYGHPGVLTEKTMIAHDCLGKECRHFKKNEAASYWVKIMQERLKREAEKQEKKKAKEKAAEKKVEIADLKNEFQNYADKLDYDLEIIRLEELETNAYRMFYVSDNRFADGNHFPELLSEIRSSYPRIHIQLRHIKDIDGHFVTIDEYHSRRRK